MTSANAAGNAAVAQTVASSGAGGANLGKYYAVTQAMSALMGAASGFAGRRAANSEADLLNAQADLALQEARREAQLKKSSVISFRESQAQKYNASGVLIDGSPMAVLSDTVRKGNEEIDAIMKRGEAMSNLYRMRARQTRNAGTGSLLGSLFGAGSGLANSFIMGNKLGLFGNGGTTTGNTATPLPPTVSINPAIGTAPVPNIPINIG